MDAKQVAVVLTDANKYTDNSTLLSNCRYLLLQLGSPVVSSIYREQNRLVDGLARKVISTALPSSLYISTSVTAATTTFWSPSLT